VGNVEWNQRFGRRVLVKLGFLKRRGQHEFILTPDPALGELRLSSSGTSRYTEMEVTSRYLGGDRRDLTASYVWSRGTADLNSYDQFFGNFRSPIVRANEHNLTPTDVRHRVIVRGTIGLPGQWDLAPVIEFRSGFPWSAVDEFQDFIGPRNRYVCGDEITIADYFGACLVTTGELIGCDLGAYPNVCRWLANMKGLRSWDKINEIFSGFAAGNKEKEFARL